VLAAALIAMQVSDGIATYNYEWPPSSSKFSDFVDSVPTRDERVTSPSAALQSSPSPLVKTSQQASKAARRTHMAKLRLLQLRSSAGGQPMPQFHGNAAGWKPPSNAAVDSVHDGAVQTPPPSLSSSAELLRATIAKKASALPRVTSRAAASSSHDSVWLSDKNADKSEDDDDDDYDASQVAEQSPSSDVDADDRITLTAAYPPSEQYADESKSFAVDSIKPEDRLHLTALSWRPSFTELPGNRKECIRCRRRRTVLLEITDDDVDDGDNDDLAATEDRGGDDGATVDDDRRRLSARTSMATANAGRKRRLNQRRRTAENSLPMPTLDEWLPIQQELVASDLDDKCEGRRPEGAVDGKAKRGGVKVLRMGK
jgi:hypothetical protein